MPPPAPVEEPKGVSSTTTPTAIPNAATVAPFYPGLAGDLLSSSLRRYHQAGVWATRPEVSCEGFARLAASLFSGGFVSRIHSYDDCVDQSLY